MSETDNRRREFLKLAAFSIAGLTTTSARALGQARGKLSSGRKHRIVH